MWAAQRHLLYRPQTNIQAPTIYGLQDFEDLHLQSADGTHVQVWHRKARAGYPTIVYFHGNGGHLGGRAHYYKLLSDAGFGILALSYRGYGSSEGRPSEEGFYQDARATMEYASTKTALKPHDIIIYGESIGTGVAVQMATEFPTAALVLQSPYTSVDAVAADKYPWIPTHWLLKDHFDSLSKISKVHVPLLLFHGEKDTIVPIRLGKMLFEKANAPKRSIYLPEKGHVDFDLAFLTNTLIAFSTEQKIISSK
ncbi:MAG: alpha/beta hydrolase [Rickettsiales bacterium]|nr:alpha/beta hydrolase [Rickettsiales bacterium]